MQAKIQKLYLDDVCRILVMSDIHANCSRLKRLLKKMNYQPNQDYLIINGDMIEKGPQNIEVVDYLKHLSETTENVYITMGNCDYLITELLEEENLIPYFQRRKDSYVNQLLATLDIDLQVSEYTPKALKELLLTHFSDELLWLADLPFAYETADHIFVHAGLPKYATELSTLDYQTMLTIREFYLKGHSMDQMVVVGHYPVRNYFLDEAPNDNILIDETRKIICIDGSNQLEVDGQLNGLIIHKDGDQYEYESYAVDEFPEQVVERDYLPEPEIISNVTFPYLYIDVIEQKEDFTLCHIQELEEDCWLKNEYINTTAENPCLLRYHTVAKLAVNKGERVKIVDNTCSGYTYIKKDGVLGWVPKTVFEVHIP